MLPLYESWFSHIEINNFCGQNCAYCTRYIRHLRPDQRSNMDLDTFRKCVISMEGFLGRIGIIGGEPILHPQFEEICVILKDELQIPRGKLGLWTSGGPRFKKYEALINETFGMLAYNEHNERQRMVEKHHPLTVAIDELVEDKEFMWELIDECWVQAAWCPSVNSKGAFFCEVAQAIDTITDGPGGWDIEKGWWLKDPKDFMDQVKRYCKMCGAAVPLKTELLDSKKEKFTPKLLELFREKNLPFTDDEDVEIISEKMSRYEIEQNRLTWDPRNYRQDIRKDMPEGYKRRPLQPQVGGPIVIKGKKK